MSKHEIIIRLLNRIELLVPLINSMGERLLQYNLQTKEILNTREAANFMGCSIRSIYRWRHNGQLKTSRPNNGRLYIEKIVCYNWMLSITTVSISEKASEEEKLAILNPERG